MIVEKLCGPMSVMLSRRNLRFIMRKARAKYRGNKSEAVRRMVDAAEAREKREKQRKR